jgi:hypothetical protein
LEWNSFVVDGTPAARDLSSTVKYPTGFAPEVFARDPRQAGTGMIGMFSAQDRKTMIRTNLAVSVDRLLSLGHVPKDFRPGRRGWFGWTSPDLTGSTRSRTKAVTQPMS